MKSLVTLAGLDFDDLDIVQSAAWIAGRPADAPFGYVVTPNADHLVRVSRDPQLRAIYRGAALCLLDSRVVGWLARLMGMPAPAIAPGSDLTAHLLAHHLAPGERITIVGLSPVWLPALIARCGLATPAHYNPPMGFDRDPVAFANTIAFVRANPARLVFLAVGSPRQEHSRGRPCSGRRHNWHRVVYRSELGVPLRSLPACAADFAIVGPGVAVPLCQQSAEAVSTLRNQ